VGSNPTPAAFHCEKIGVAVSTHAIPPLVALTHDPDVKIPPAQLAAVGAALQKQVTRDFAPAWGQPATVAAFPPGPVPPGYWRIVVKKQVPSGDYGYHSRAHREPAAIVYHTRDWPLTASHELLEMLADPWGSRLIVADDPRGTKDRVRVLVEACDPCEEFHYTVDGIELSDFVLPAYYGPHRWRHGGKSPAGASAYSFTGAVSAPLSVAKGGYLSFVDTKDVWWQQRWFGSRRSVKRLGRIADGDARSPRAFVDAELRRSRA
jgi:hypothetical protein